MQITKGEGAILTIPAMACYIVPYFVFVYGNKYAFVLVSLFSVGAFLLFLRVLEKSYELMFLHKGTKVFWDEGMVLLPAVPILQNFGLSIPFGLRGLTEGADLDLHEDGPHIHHHVDQRLPDYKVSTNATFFQVKATLYSERALGAFFKWLFGVMPGRRDLIFPRLGTRIMLVTLLIGWATNHTSVRQEAPPPEVSIQTPARTYVSESPQITKNSFTTLVNLRKGKKPVIPYKEDFEPRILEKGEAGIQYVTKEPEGDSRPYLYFMESKSEAKNSFVIEGPSCVIIPPGRVARFATQRVPVYAINMQEEVTYLQKETTFTFTDKARHFLRLIRGDSNLFTRSKSWEYVYQNWDTVDTRRMHIIGEALPLSKIPEGNIGGIVCF